MTIAIVIGEVRMTGFGSAIRRMAGVSRVLLVASVLLMITAAPALAGTPARGGTATPIVVPCVCGGVGRRSPILTTWGGPGNDTGEGIAVAGDGSLYLAGVTDSFGAGRTDVLLLKLT